MYKLYKSDWIRHFNFVIGDLLSIQAVFLIPYVVDRISPSDYEFYWLFQLTISLVSVCVVFFNESYKAVYKRGYLKEVKAVFFQVSLVFLISILITFFEKTTVVYSRLIVSVMWIVCLLVTYIVRIIIKKACIKNFKKNRDSRLILLISDDATANHTIEVLNQNRFSDFTVTGIVLNDGNRLQNGEICGIKVVASMENAADYIKNNPVDEVLISLSSNSYPVKMIEQCKKMGTVVHYVLCEEEEEENSHDVIENVGGFTVITHGFNLVTSRQLFIKRAIDIIGSIFGLILTGLCCLFVAPLVYSKSPGPIFFSQIRIGQNGRRFKMYKFRSMYMDAEARKAELMAQNKMSGFMFKLDDDPRIIKGIGTFIRKTSIDELPQMWNVLKGDMSLIGTRPPTLDEFKKYEYHHKSRLATRPGITGLWQVSGRSDITDFEEVVALDAKYIRNWTLGLDIKILFKTVLVVFKKKGSV